MMVKVMMMRMRVEADNVKSAFVPQPASSYTYLSPYCPTILHFSSANLASVALKYGSRL